MLMTPPIAMLPCVHAAELQGTGSAPGPMSVDAAAPGTSKITEATQVQVRAALLSNIRHSRLQSQSEQSGAGAPTRESRLISRRNSFEPCTFIIEAIRITSGMAESPRRVSATAFWAATTFLDGRNEVIPGTTAAHFGFSTRVGDIGSHLSNGD
jgi:hypothetical protein